MVSAATGGADDTPIEADTTTTMGTLTVFSCTPPAAADIDWRGVCKVQPGAVRREEVAHANSCCRLQTNVWHVQVAPQQQASCTQQLSETSALTRV